MRALDDSFLDFPYLARVPWPWIYYQGAVNWPETVELVQLWLDHRVGPRWVEWGWSWSTGPDVCTVKFLRSQGQLLFLLKFGSSQ